CRPSRRSFDLLLPLPTRRSSDLLWPAHEHHVRRPDWTELFFDLIFAAAISQLSMPLDADFSFAGIVRYAFSLALVFLAWFGYTADRKSTRLNSSHVSISYTVFCL